MYFEEFFNIEYTCHSGKLVITEEGNEISIENKIFPIVDIPIFCPLCKKGTIEEIELME